MHANRYQAHASRPCRDVCSALKACPYADPQARADVEPDEARAILACLQAVYQTGRPMYADDDAPGDRTLDARQGDLFL